jgi:hypothetical protein
MLSGIHIFSPQYAFRPHKNQKAHGVIAKIARINGKPVPDFSKFAEIVKAAKSTSKEKKYTIVDIVRNRTLLKYTMLVAIGI